MSNTIVRNGVWRRRLCIPGYYWLAYEPDNLLPSCQRCNQAGGKKNHFPVTGARQLNDIDVIPEEPLLLNPYCDSPFDHLRYVFSFSRGEPTGYVKGTPIRGRASVRISDLNRSEMVDDRRQAQRMSITEYETALFKGKGTEFIDNLRTAKPAYTAARLGALVSWIKWYKRHRLNPDFYLIQKQDLLLTGSPVSYGLTIEASPADSPIRLHARRGSHCSSRENREMNRRRPRTWGKQPIKVGYTSCDSRLGFTIVSDVTDRSLSHSPQGWRISRPTAKSGD